MKELLTIGYEGTTSAHLLDALAGAGVARLVDVRAVPQSRKPGFSKRILAASLAEAGIAYTHLRGLGTPKPGRDAARRGDSAGMRRIFDAHMATPEAAFDLHGAIALAASERVCLLCFERDHLRCHRAVVAELICAATGLAPVHLQPRAAAAGEP